MRAMRSRTRSTRSCRRSARAQPPPVTGLGRAACPRGGARHPESVETEVRAAQAAGGAHDRPGEASRAPATAARRRRILLVAGEASGDLHGADLLAALRTRVARRRGVRRSAASTCAPPACGRSPTRAEVATVGVVEGIGRLRALVRVYRALARCLRTSAPDLCVLIDFPEFNLRLARVAQAGRRSGALLHRAAGLGLAAGAGPQDRPAASTAWRWCSRSSRASTSAWLPGVEFVGHPLLDRVAATRGRDDTLRALRARPRAAHRAAAARQSAEGDRLHPAAAARRRRTTWRRRATTSSSLALAHTLDRADVEARIRASGLVGAGWWRDDLYNLVAASDIALVTSGTATLECALLECPMVIVYRLSPATFAARPPAGARRAPRRHAEHRRRPDGRAGAAPGRGDRAAASRRRRRRILTTRHGGREIVAGLREVRAAARAAAAPPIARRHRGRDDAGAAGMSTYRRMLRYLRPYLWPQGVLRHHLHAGLQRDREQRAVPDQVHLRSGVQPTATRSTCASRWSALGLAIAARRPIGFVAGYLNDWIGQRVVTDVRNELTAHLQRLDLAFFNRHRAGQIVSRVTADVTLMRSAVTDAVKSVFQDTTSLVGLVVGRVLHGLGAGADRGRRCSRSPPAHCASSRSSSGRTAAGSRRRRPA